MLPVNSVFIPRIEKKVNAEFIVDVFSRNGIAEVSKVFIETNKTKYNRAYVAIKSWHGTKTAENFIKRLMNPYRETRLVYNADDNWWVVEVNKDSSKLEISSNVLTIFRDKELFIDDDLSLQAIIDEDETDVFESEPDIDYNKTNLLKEVVANLKNNNEDLEDFASYLDEMEKGRALLYSDLCTYYLDDI